MCEEVRRRILISIWAYAYEFENISLVPDAVYDTESSKIDLTVCTSRPDLDVWFRDNFNPSTGVWVYGHPELEKIKRLYNDLY